MINSVQLLRLIAALLVFGAHIPQWALLQQNPFNCSRDAMMCGAIGVDIFFCISGFLMYVTTVKRPSGPATALSFFVRRLFRIWPLYIFATILYMSYWQVPILSYLRPLLFLPIEQPIGFRDPPIAAGWTLNFEMYFYVVTAVALLLPWKVKGAAIAVTALGLLSLFLGNTFYFIGSIIVEFALGVLIGAIYLHKPLWATLYRYRFPFLVLSITCFSLAAYGTDWPRDPGEAVPRMEVLIYSLGTILPRFIAWGVPSFFLMLSLMLYEKSIPKTAAKLGDYTYSIYLLYLPTATWVELYAKSLPPSMRTTLYENGGLVIALLVVLFAGSAITYHLIERPFQAIGGVLARRLETKAPNNSRRSGLSDERAGAQK